jgi:predicted RNA polymerase sigma factor
MSVPLDEQDRTLWYKEEIRTGLALLDQAVARRAPGPYQLKAAIAACHVNGNQPDWVQIAALYNQLIQLEPTAVVQVNRAVAIAKAGAPQAALDMLISIEDQLAAYQPFYAAKAELLSVMNKYDAAIRAFDQAIALASSPADAAFLERRRDVLNSI